MKDGQGSQCAGGGWPSSAIHDAGDRQGLEGFARAQANHGSMAEAAFPSLFHARQTLQRLLRLVRLCGDIAGAE